MKQATLLLALVSSSLLSAAGQELHLMATHMSTHADQVSAHVFLRPAHLTAISLRYGHDVAAFGPTSLQIQATYQAEAKGSIPIENHQRFTFTAPVTYYKQEGYAVGLQAQWHYLAEFGLGPELRLEHLKSAGKATSQIRPWLIARLGWKMPSADLCLVTGLECAWALSNPKRDGTWMVDNNGMPVFVLTRASFVQSLAPNFAVSVYFGVRF